MHGIFFGGKSCRKRLGRRRWEVLANDQRFGSLRQLLFLCPKSGQLIFWAGVVPILWPTTTTIYLAIVSYRVTEGIK